MILLLSIKTIYWTIYSSVCISLRYVFINCFLLSQAIKIICETHIILCSLYGATMNKTNIKIWKKKTEIHLIQLNAYAIHIVAHSKWKKFTYRFSYIFFRSIYHKIRNNFAIFFFLSSALVSLLEFDVCCWCSHNLKSFSM